MNRHVTWLARVAASAAVRKVVYWAVGGLIALAIAFVPTGKAQAQTVDDARCMAANQEGNIGSPSPLCSSQEIAYANTGNWLRANRPAWDGVIDGPACINNGRYCRYRTDHGGSYVDVRYYDSQAPCPPGNVWNDAVKQCVPSNCISAPDHGGAMAKGFNMCKDGCRYEQAATGGVSACIGSGADMTCFADNWKATGARCEPNDKPPQVFDSQQETCRSLGGGAGSYSECVKPDGKHCVTSSAGAVLCWKPSDVGDRMTTDGKLGGDREVAPATPEPPENMADPTQVTTTTTTIGGTTYNTSIYNGTGNNGGQGNVGEGGKNTGGTGDPKGEGEGGNGTGDGEGDNDWGTPGAGVGDQYQGTDKTVGSVFGTFKGRVEGSPLIGAATGFFTGCSGGGSCPSETWDGGDFAGQHDLSALCSGALASLLGYAGWVCLAGMGAVGFRIALL